MTRFREGGYTAPVASGLPRVPSGPAPGERGRAAHTVTLTPHPHPGSVPFTFAAACSCGWATPANAFKWTALAVQGHYADARMTNGRGLIRDVAVEGGHTA